MTSTLPEPSTLSDPVRINPPPPHAGSAPEPRELIIEPESGWVPVDWNELVHYRELLYSLVIRDVKVRYKQTVLGAAWAILQPLFGMVVFTMIFGKLAGIKSDGVPYALFVFAGLVPWTFFANGVSAAAQSLINQQQMLTKVYFPRLLVPVSAFGAPMLDMLISLGVMAVIMACYRFAPPLAVLALPALIIMTSVAGIGVGLVLAALTVSYRDFRFVITFMIQAWMYVSPVIYPTSLIPAKYRLLAALNPMTGLLDGYRAALLGTPCHWGMLAVSSLSSAALLIYGLFYFRKVECRFADVI